MHTRNQSPIGERVHCPDVWSPVRVAQSPGEWEEPVLQLQQLTPLRKRPKGNCKDTNHTDSKFDDVPNSGSEDGFGIETIGAQQVDKVGKGKVQVDVLHAQQDCEKYTTVQEGGLLPSQNDG